MKKLIVIVIAVAICVAVILARYSKKEGIYRLHIIANSNSAEDQDIKLKVRDAILSCEAKLFAKQDVTSAKQAKSLLMNNAHSLYFAAKKALADENFGYDIKLATGTYSFPDKTYAGVCYPAGEYDALRVVLGDGKGENWWCVMFPPLCIMNDNTAENDDNKAVEFKSIFGKVGKWFADLFNVTA